MQLRFDRVGAGLVLAAATNVLGIAAVRRSAIRRACRFQSRNVAQAREIFAAYRRLVYHKLTVPGATPRQTNGCAKRLWKGNRT